MSSTEEVADSDQNVLCASCGTAVDEIKFPIGGMSVTLANSFECNGVRCCSVECREDHEERHDEGCNELREELHDKTLFTQPDISHRGECPICFLPLSLDSSKSMFWTCCSETICNGCVHANHKSSNGGDRCPFCREQVFDDEDIHKRLTKRVKANDPAALSQMGWICYNEGDDEGAFEYWTKAAELGNVDSHYVLASMYNDGRCIEKNMIKEVYHLETAAMGGHPTARYSLGCIEERNGNMERSVKHLIIGSNLGDEYSMKMLREHYADGNITKEELDATLRAHQDAVDATKSSQRDAAEVDSVREAGELYNKALFTQPESTHLGECPLCFLPLPIDEIVYNTCCGEIICMGCNYANRISNGSRKCPFCREPAVSKEEVDKRLVKRVKANDPVAMSEMGGICYDEGDYDGALDYWTKAAELGDIKAHYEVGLLYELGDGVERDDEKAVYHFEKAAIGGHPYPRFYLGCYEGENGNTERSVKHFTIAANLGMEASMSALQKHYSEGNITKEDLEATLRTHQAAIDGMKSPQRETAEEYLRTKEANQSHDKELFQQPEISHLGECPICFLPLSLDMSKSILKSCCSKLICSGCICANIKCNINDPVKGWSCPLCRDPCDEKYGKRNMKKLMKRVKANDPAALCEIGKTRHQEGNFVAAFKYLTKAAELGDASAHHNLSCMYRDGQGVEKDEEKEIHHSERAAIGGHPDARFKLGCHEGGNGNMKRAAKHLIIGANLGCDKSMEMLWNVYRGGCVSKEELEAALRGHKAAVDATKSEQRYAAECGGEWRQIIIAQMRR